MTIPEIAKIAHETNRAYCSAFGDNSQVAWENCPEWQQTSAVTGVKFIIDNPDSGPSHQHECWMQEKEKDGWKYGPVKNPKAKEHPCMVPYDQLPESQKAKDYIFGAIVRNLIPYLHVASA